MAKVKRAEVVEKEKKEENLPLEPKSENYSDYGEYLKLKAELNSQKK